MLEIAAFGKISVGKSALLNALFATEIFTVDPRGGSTAEPQRHIVSFSGQQLAVIDTPGIGEVGGAARTQQARDIAKHVDLVLVLFDQDPTHMEHAEVQALAQANKPFLVLLNKADALSEPQREELRERILMRLGDHVDADNVLICAADPVRYRAVEHADGSIEEWAERAEPDLAQVRQRLQVVLLTEGDSLQQVDEVAKRTSQEEERLRQARDRAGDLIDDFALGIAVGVAANPIPLVDVLGGGTAMVVLINKLAACYGLEVQRKEVEDLAKQLVKDGWKQLLPAAVPLLGGALLKGIPLVGWALGALGQATAAYYITYVLGHTCSEYFAADKTWAGSLRETIEQVLARTDKKSVSRRAAERIKERLRGNKEDSGDSGS